MAIPDSLLYFVMREPQEQIFGSNLLMVCQFYKHSLQSLTPYFSPIMLRVTAVVVASLCQAAAAQGLASPRDSGYSAPEQSYHQPEPSYGYEATETSPDITPVLIGVLILTGLALLFPSYVNLTTVRRKRSSEGHQGKRSIFQPS